MTRLSLHTYRLLPVLLAITCVACSAGPTRTVLSRPAADTTTSATEELAVTSWNTRDPGEIAPGFHIELANAGDPKINGVFTVQPDGGLKLPYDVKITAAGKTTAQLRNEVNEAYTRYLASPSIQVSIARKEYYVDVRGLVAKPGHYLVKGDSSLDFLISSAGGLLQGNDQQAAAQYVRIDQLGVTNVIRLRDYFSGDQSILPRWQGGETVFFQSERPRGATPGRDYVQVLGQVRSPGDYPYTPGADFYEYLIRAGGPTDRADLHNVTLVRNIGDRQREAVNFALDESDQIPAIQGGDTLLLHADNPSPLEKKSRVIGGFASILSTIATVVLLFVTV